MDNKDEILTYTNNRYQQFVDDMRSAGIIVEHYRGRFYYEGPAARTHVSEGIDLQDIMSATKVKLQWDNLGKEDFIVYPRD